MDLDFDFDFDLDNFADIEVDLAAQAPSRYIKPPITKEIQEINLKYSDALALARDIKMDPGERYYVIVNGTFYFGDFLEALIKEKNYRVREMTVSTLSLCENNVDSFANLLSGLYVKDLNLIISDYFFSHERHNLVKYLYQELDKEDRFQLAVARTHCKTCLIKTVCGRHIVIHGSANLRTSGNIEQFVVEDSQALYDFNYEYQKAIIDKYKTIQKPLKNSATWEAVAPRKPGKNIVEHKNPRTGIIAVVNKEKATISYKQPK